MGNLFKNIKRLIALAIFLVLIAGIAFACYIVYLESNTSAAKAYLIDTYGLNEKKLKPKKYIQYVYNDVADCGSLWLKKCTDDETLEYQYVFQYEDKTITVSEDKKSNLTDDSGLTPVEKDSKDNIKKD